MTENEKIQFLDSMRGEIDQVISEIKQKYGKYIYKYTWLSGSSTDVYPITVWRDNISVQLDTDDKRHFQQKSLNDIVEKHKGLLTRAEFEKSDGSCPSELNFYFIK